MAAGVKVDNLAQSDLRAGELQNVSRRETTTHIVRRVVGRFVPVRVDALDPRAQVGSDGVVCLALGNVDTVVDTEVRFTAISHTPPDSRIDRLDQFLRVSGVVCESCKALEQITQHTE